MKKLRQEKKNQEKAAKELRNVPNRKEREEIETLKKQMAQL